MFPIKLLDEQKSPCNKRSPFIKLKKKVDWLQKDSLQILGPRKFTLSKESDGRSCKLIITIKEQGILYRKWRITGWFSGESNDKPRILSS